jgi:hypothetical protein
VRLCLVGWLGWLARGDVRVGVMQKSTKPHPSNNNTHANAKPTKQASSRCPTPSASAATCSTRRSPRCRPAASSC